MALAPNFDKHLREFLEHRVSQCEWKAPWSADGQQWKVDVAGLPKKSGPLVLVEVELKKDNPVENVVKIWRWAKDEKKTQRILFVQAFSAHYKTKKQKQFVRSKFIGERMEEDSSLRIKYKIIHMKYKPRKGNSSKGAGRMLRAARLLAPRVAKLFSSN
jgi:hypothetical protein